MSLLVKYLLTLKVGVRYFCALNIGARCLCTLKSRCKVSLHLEGRPLCDLHINECINVLIQDCLVLFVYGGKALRWGLSCNSKGSRMR